jgi:hypothetical protein
VLAHVTDEKDPVATVEAFKELMHLRGAGEARLIEDPARRQLDLPVSDN